jgi:hypothetical protein
MVRRVLVLLLALARYPFVTGYSRRVTVRVR